MSHSPGASDRFSAQKRFLTYLARLVLDGNFRGAGVLPTDEFRPASTSDNQPVEELKRSTLSITLGFVVLCPATFFLRDLSNSRLVYVLGYLPTGRNHLSFVERVMLDKQVVHNVWLDLYTLGRHFCPECRRC